ncbi:energy-coupling factor transporter ATPase [Anaerovorax odorimutans]|uniref:Energy-coupling factor transporter ATP-binding protein EcfA2 n=1 Tax=Anaerovorax odorimutans TaxID=109327 RepID=A0ABT1RJU7_9FIRM|nr:energy-coupling factor transporter ATPase [Anaerovorax odorimutans]MCQ4635454.1 energy-coupling factor transporter ATPase [Anaerovorax odorimutans]
MSIQVNNLTHIYSEGMPHQSVALEDVTFSADDGQFIGIIGHTGSGKSTLVQHLNGLLKPKSGTIVVSGTDITASGVVMRDIRRKIGLVFQYPEYQLFEETVEKDVAFGPLNLGLDEAEVSVRVREALDLVGLDYEEIHERSPFDLSGGQKRRVAIAGVIAMKPEVLILDEPTAGLDPKAHQDVLKMIETVHAHEKNIIFLVSHNMNDIARMADKILVMDSGKLVMHGTPEEVFSREEELTSMGLALPEPAQLMKLARQKGLPFDGSFLRVEDAEEALYQFLKKDSFK